MQLQLKSNDKQGSSRTQQRRNKNETVPTFQLLHLKKKWKKLYQNPKLLKFNTEKSHYQQSALNNNNNNVIYCDLHFWLCLIIGNNTGHKRRFRFCYLTKIDRQFNGRHRAEQSGTCVPLTTLTGFYRKTPTPHLGAHDRRERVVRHIRGLLHATVA